jgi:hypothetical protein
MHSRWNKILSGVTILDRLVKGVVWFVLFGNRRLHCKIPLNVTVRRKIVTAWSAVRE